MTLNRSIRDLAEQVVVANNKPNPSREQFRIVWATVVSIQTSTRTLTLNVAGSSTSIAGIHYLSSYTPTVNDTVMCTWHGYDLVVIGGMAGTTVMGIVIPITYAVQGLLAATSGATDYMPVSMWTISAGQNVKLLSVRMGIRAAGSGSCNIDIQRNGSGITGLTGLTAGTTRTTTTLSTPLTLATNDEIGFIINSISGAPDGLTVAINVSISG